MRELERASLFMIGDKDIRTYLSTGDKELLDDVYNTLIYLRNNSDYIKAIQIEGANGEVLANGSMPLNITRADREQMCIRDRVLAPSDIVAIDYGTLGLKGVIFEGISGMLDVVVSTILLLSLIHILKVKLPSRGAICLDYQKDLLNVERQLEALDILEREDYSCTFNLKRILAGVEEPKNIILESDFCLLYTSFRKYADKYFLE